jgi:predicted transcriptional regulator
MKSAFSTVGRPWGEGLTVERLMRASPPLADANDRLAAAAARMRRSHVGALPVVEAGHLVGIISSSRPGTCRRSGTASSDWSLRPTCAASGACPEGLLGDEPF